MSFECAVMADDSRCAATDAGDTVYLGALTFCREHQEAFEELVQGKVLIGEVVGAKLNRLLGPTFRNPSPVNTGRTTDLRSKATVYFFRCEGYIKIGVSTVPRLRIQQVRAGTVKFPEGMSIASTQIVTTEPGGYPREKQLHAKFAHLRAAGEWFTETPELATYINSLLESEVAA